MTESFFIYKLEYLIFSGISFFIPESKPLYNKKKPIIWYFSFVPYSFKILLSEQKYKIISKIVNLKKNIEFFKSVLSF